MLNKERQFVKRREPIRGENKVISRVCKRLKEKERWGKMFNLCDLP